jgi:phospholipid/cholesterol/gamma-HCH transport system substrate-binding protein
VRRGVITFPIVGVVVVAIVLALSSGGSNSYSFAAVFDNADGIVGGMQVKVAGVVVGSVNSVTLVSTPAHPKARLAMSIDPRFGPFHRNATCTILPEGLLSENYVECSPGSRTAPPLGRAGGQLPTVPLTQTTVPATLQDLLNVFSMPVDDRIRVLIDELGIATAGQGENLNALLERSNPALAQAGRALSIIDAQRQELATGIAQTNQVLAALGTRSVAVHQFVDQAAVLARTTAAHRSPLEQSIERLPALLRAATPALRSLDTTTAAGVPLLHDLRTAAPLLNRTTQLLPPVFDAGPAAFNSLGSAASIGQSAVRAATPVVAALRQASSDAQPFAPNLDRLLISLRDTGGIEGMMSFFYGLAETFSGYDQISHVFMISLDFVVKCLANPAALGCSSAYSSPGQGTLPVNDPSCGPQQGAIWDPPVGCTPQAVSLRVARAPRRAERSRRPTPTRTGPPAPATSTPPAPGAPAPTRTSPLAPILSPVLGTVGRVLGKGTTGATGTTGTPVQGLSGAVHSLLTYLLGK